MFERFTEDARRAIVLAETEARLEGAKKTAPRHLVLGTLACEPVVALVGDQATPLVTALQRGQVGGAPFGDRVPLTTSARWALEEAEHVARRLNHAGITAIHILLAAVACTDPEVEEAVRLTGLDTSALMATVETLPSVSPADSMVDQMRRYLDSGNLIGETRCRYEDLLVLTLIEAGDVVAARTAALAHAAGGNPLAAAQLVQIGELVGDVGLILDHADAALEATDEDAAFRAARGTALAHSGRFDEARRELTTAADTADEQTRDAVLLDAAEAEILAGNPDSATNLLALIEPPDPDAQPLRYLAWLRLKLEIGAALGDLTELVSTVPPFESRVFDMAFRAALDVTRLRVALGDTAPRVVARQARELAGEAERVGLRSIAASARAVRGEALRRAGSRRWRNDIEVAATELEDLGRLVHSRRLRQMLGSD